MKKLTSIKTLLLLVTMAALFSACDEDCISGDGPVVSREIFLDDFSSISLLGSENLVITQGPVQRVVIEAQQNIINRVNTRVSGQHWNAYVEGCVRNSRDITYYVTVPNLEHIGLSGSGKVVSTGNFDSDDMSVILSGSGRIEAKVNSESFYANITGSGKIDVDGFAENSEVIVSGSGRFRGFDLFTENTRANITGSGDAEVNVSTYLEARISGSGNVIYRGNPSIDSDITGSGKVKHD